MSNLLTNSRLSCFRSCPRKHYIRYELGIRPDGMSDAMRVGSAFHRALEADYNGEVIETAIGERVESPYDLALVAAMFSGHKTRWQDHPVESLAVEQPFEIALRNPETGAKTTVWNLAGVIDRIVKLPDGRLALMEHKTTTRDFAPGADYWVRLHMDQQLSIYLIAARELGYNCETILYDVTRRPMLRPLKATPEESRKYKGDGVLYANQRAVDETPEEFAVRVAADIAERPDHYFTRIEIARLDQDLDECAWEVWQQQLTIREAQRSGRWSRNPDACFSNNGTCEYLSICQGCDLVNSVPFGFTKVSDVHPEISRVANAGQAAYAQE